MITLTKDGRRESIRTEDGRRECEWVVRVTYQLLTPTNVYRLLLILLFAGSARVSAQQTGTGLDSAVARARNLVASGKGAAGRLIIDSLLTAIPPDSASYAEALYWRAALASTPANAERDFRRIVVEYPLSRRAGASLLRLAQFEQQRGDRELATQHLERFLLENPRDSARARAGFALTKLLFEQNFVARGCVALTRTLAEVPADSVEFRNQLQFYSPRCANTDTTKAADPNKLPDTTTAKLTRADGKFTLQFAAYKKKEDAERLAAKLKKQGIETRIIQTANWFKVRSGRYKTRADAAKAAREMDKKGFEVMVTTSGDDDP